MPSPSPRPAARLLAPLLIVLLSACSDPFQVWHGTSTHDDTARELRLEVRQSGPRLHGGYHVGSARGGFEGHVDGTALTATLTPGSDCTYRLTGTMTSDTLAATYAPDDCPGGSSGTWRLERR